MLKGGSHIRARGGLIGSLVFLGLLAGGCASSRPAHRIAQFTNYARAQAGFTPEQQTFIEDNCPFGMPKTDPGWEFGPTALVIREGYVLQHSSTDRIPLWVCERVTKEELEEAPGVVRKDLFAPDPQLAGKPRAELSDYKGSGYDRGHQAPAGDQNHSQRLKNETFFLSNMAPQLGALNQRVWRGLEDLTRQWVEDGDVPDEYIITGGLFYDPAEDNPATADGIINYSTIGPDQVAVPTHFYKIVVAKDSSGNWRAVAFVLENRGYPSPWNFADFVRPVRWIEDRTGLDFMPDLDPMTAHQIEESNGALWSH